MLLRDYEKNVESVERLMRRTVESVERYEKDY